ncbi:MAG: hypothetical protein KatS3mg008_1457 [Acidimicrobiales bacterium]|nr:MAG: hypothetical protein KatS3mg008_1457 [Acidimicrobiales bacterium]
MEVELVRWPSEQSRRAALASRGVPRLLLVDPEAPAPTCDDPAEDWIRIPAPESDVRARVTSLRLRVDSMGPRTPKVDADGVLRFDGRRVPLPPVEARIAAALAARFGAVVGRDQLVRAGWPERSPRRNALDVHILRLRRRIETVGLRITTVRARGYMLERAPDVALDHPPRS